VVKLGNEVVGFRIVFENVQGQPYDRKCLWNPPRKTI
jgi:hypothetical protein